MSNYPPCFEKVKELNEAIRNEKYKKVKEMLADPQVPVNIGCYKQSSTYPPLHTMFSLGNWKMAKLFLDCPRIDWLAPVWRRNMHSCQEEYGFQFEDGTDGAQRANTDDYFYNINYYFAQKCPEEAELIYERIFDELKRLKPSDNYDHFLFKARGDKNALKAALKFSSNINARDKDGNTLLHIDCNFESVKFLLEKGADVNAVNHNGDTPLLNGAKDLKIVRLLVSHGADTNFINPANESLFSMCFQQYGHELWAYLKRFKIADEVFVSAVNLDGSAKLKLNEKELEEIFDDYPHFKPLYESSELCAVKRFYDSCNRRKGDEVSDEEYLKRLRQSFVDLSSYYPTTIFRLKKEFVIKRANQLLHEACSVETHNGRINTTEHISELVEKYNADPNSIVDGTTVLFKVKKAAFLYELLSKYKANTFTECDGYLFFERPDFLSQNDDEYDKYWLECLNKMGFDLFKPATKTGKSLIDCLNQKALVSFHTGNLSVKIPVRKLSKESFQINDQCLTAPIDKDGNTILHYYASTIVRGECKSLFAIEINKNGLASLKACVNNEGKIVYQLCLDDENCFALIRDIKDSEVTKEFVLDCLKVHGDGLMKQRGGEMVSSALARGNLSLAEYLLDEKGISIMRIIQDLPLIDYCWNSCFGKEESLAFIIKHARISLYQFDTLLTSKHDGALMLLIETCEDLSPYIVHFCLGEHQPESDPGFYTFLEHERVRTWKAPGSQNDCTILDQYYFYLLRMLSNDARLLHKLGVDARKLAGSGLEPIGCKGRWDEPILAVLKRIGWTLKDFEALSIADYVSHDYTFRQYFGKKAKH